jgi:hypothetical protein
MEEALSRYTMQEERATAASHAGEAQGGDVELF